MTRYSKSMPRTTSKPKRPSQVSFLGAETIRVPEEHVSPFFENAMLDTNDQYFGFIEKVDFDGITGWAFDFGKLKQSVWVHVYLEDVFVGRACANCSREDIAEKIGLPIQTGFQLKWREMNILPDRLASDPEGRPRIRVVIADTNLSLSTGCQLHPTYRMISNWSSASWSQQGIDSETQKTMHKLSTLPHVQTRKRSSIFSRHAAITIISKNYFAFAKVLAKTYLQQHPKNDFLIILVDKADGYIPETLSCGAEVIEISNFNIPKIEHFIYQYSILELNTAVKPFVLADLFEQRGYQTIVYLDPDILVTAPLSAIYDALSRHSIALIPHMRSPFFDGDHPSDLTILQSGTYNLGFIGLRKGISTKKFLAWWMEKLYHDCIVDIPNGLFLDQKWIDLVPGFFQDHKIIYHPGYNAAYWNLHERKLENRSGEWFVGDLPLVFFHFSGYLPFAPLTFSKHQRRHALDRMPLLKRLTDTYSQQLIEEGYEESNSWPYAFGTLSNGVALPLGVVRDVLQWAVRSKVQTPNPVIEPDVFCKFLMSRDVVPGRPNVVLLFHFILKQRPDVAAAFPAASNDSGDEGFRHWVATSGIRELGVGDLLPFESANGIANHVADAFQRLRVGRRQDVFERFQDMWKDVQVFFDFADWFTLRGISEMGFSEEHAHSLKRAFTGIEKILNIYFLRGDLQLAYPSLADSDKFSPFFEWLLANRFELNLSTEEITLFFEYSRASSDLVEKMRFMYQHNGGILRSIPSIYDIDFRCKEIGISIDDNKIRNWLFQEDAIEAVDHFLSKFPAGLSQIDDYERCSVPKMNSKDNFEFVRRLKQSIDRRLQDQLQINFAGFLNAPSGMGESARSMRATLAHTDRNYHTVTLPHPRNSHQNFPTTPVHFGWPTTGAALSITVANADSKTFIESFLPRSYWAQKNVGYWVWETEELPDCFQSAQEIFDEIWTPSKYSAIAIERTVDLPVKVMPHTLDFNAISGAKSDRKKLILPQHATLFGFIFDPQSVIERKNLNGLINAFTQAFRRDDDCYLVLKINGNPSGSLEYELIRRKVESDRIIFLDADFTRAEILSFMKSLDVYVSLHRSEGFGLTCAECMALGVPVVASNYSGNLDFMNPSNSCLIDTRVIETDRRYGSYPAGTKWGDPDLEHAISTLRLMRDDAFRREVGKRGQISVHQSLGAKKIGMTAHLLISNLLGLSNKGYRKKSDPTRN